MLPVEIIAVTVAYSLSGVLSPGPLTAAVVAEGAIGGWKSGVKAAAGHMLFEMPYVILVTALFNATSLLRGVPLNLLAVLSSLYMLYLAYLGLRDALKGVEIEPKGGGRPFLTGFLLTGLNPYFLLWWLSQGAGILDAWRRATGLILLPALYLSHVWLDFTWLGLLAEGVKRGVAVFRRNGYRAVLAGASILLAYMALKTLADALFLSSS